MGYIVKEISKAESGLMPDDLTDPEWTVKHYAWLNDDDIVPVLHFHLQIKPPIAQIHVYVHRWSAGILRDMRRAIPDVLIPICKTEGISTMIGVKLSNVDKWSRFCKLLGFQVMSFEDGKYIKLEVDTWESKRQ